MAIIEIKELSYTWPGALTPVFRQVNLNLDTSWRLGLVGRNGRGKTTFLRLLMGEIQGSGSITTGKAFEYFPPLFPPAGQTTMEAAKAVVAPFTAWEADMKRLIDDGSEAAIQHYGEIEAQYAALGGYTIEESILAETGRLGVHPGVLIRPFSTLSGGEQLKVLLAAAFLKKNHFLLIDEPTDHLDREGRNKVAHWLKSKSGFILVSHDRHFLDAAVDHILSINKADIELQQGNYSLWRENRRRQDAFEEAENQKREANIRRLQTAAAQTKRWSDKVEKSKKQNSSYNKGSAAVDRGYIGHQAAKMMQRSKAIARRQEREIDQQKGLLKNVESAEPLKFLVLPSAKKRMVAAENLSMQLGERRLFEALGFSIEAGERIAVTGANGCGKSTLLRLVQGLQIPTGGNLWVASDLHVSALPQDTGGLAGSLQHFAESHGVELSLFLAILRKLDFPRTAFTQDMAHYSAGQKKKAFLAASLATPAQLFIWDEPLNYIDVLSREQLEAATLSSNATLLFVEHDEAFLRAAATKRIEL